MKLSIIIPVFNEEKTIREILLAVNAVRLDGIKKEIIVVDDGSTDVTVKKILNIKSQLSNFKFMQHKTNQGKGSAVATGIHNASGEMILIQDADLEYNPKQIEKLMEPILSGNAKVVYGTRLNRLPNMKKDERNPLFLTHYFGNRFLSLITSILYGEWITDMETCYKLFPKDALKNTPIRARGFEFEPEITAKLLKNGYKITEIPIVTTPRGYGEGKKLHTVRDGIKALWTLAKYRFMN